MKVFAFLFLMLPVSVTSNAQTNEFRAQRTRMAVFNVGTNALFAGFGSLINEKKERRNFKTFLKDSAKEPSAEQSVIPDFQCRT